jgi:hypothetical protein
VALDKSGAIFDRGTETILRSFLYFLVFATLPLLVTEGFAQKLVDPNTVAPEYREAAQKRRAEQIRQLNCSHKADVEKVLPRERTTFLVHCLDTAEQK